MPLLQVNCPSCGNTHSVTPQLQGRKTRCTCGQVFRMPGDKLEPSRPQAQTANAAPRTTQIQAISAECPSCHQHFQIRPELAGKKTRCHCGTIFVVPTNETIPLVSSAPRDEIPTLQLVDLPVVAPAIAPPVGPITTPTAPMVDANDPFAIPGVPLGSANPQGSYAPYQATNPGPGSGTPPPTNQYWLKPPGSNSPANVVYTHVKSSKNVQSSSSSDSGISGPMLSILGGFGLIALGGGITIITYSVASSSPTGGSYVLFYGPIVAGLVMVVRGFIGMASD